MNISDEAVKAATKAFIEHGTLLPALEASARHMLIHVHHHDIEHHARSFNEGYDTAMAQELADDPTLAQGWLDEKLAEAWDEGHDSAADEDPKYTNPYRSQA